MFSADYTTLRQIIHQFAYTGVFHAKVAATRSLAQEGDIELHVNDGVILVCFFINVRGQRYKWDIWEEQLSKFGTLNWELISNALPAPLPQVPPAMPSQPSAPMQRYLGISQQVIPLSAAQMSQQPMICRQVYFLIDGRRQISDIAFILRKSPHEIAQVINYLMLQGFISLR
jgi:hypothetical protein